MQIKKGVQKMQYKIFFSWDPYVERVFILAALQ